LQQFNADVVLLIDEIQLIFTWKDGKQLLDALRTLMNHRKLHVGVLSM
jgi:hypothetical protein